MRARKQIRNLVSSIMDSISVGLIIIDEQYRIISWNRWMENNTGSMESEVTGKNILDLYPSIAHTGKERYLRECIEENKPLILSPFFHKYLIPIEMEQSDAPAEMIQKVKLQPIKQGSQTFAIIIIEDVTEQFYYEEELARLNRLLRLIRNIDRLVVESDSEEDILKKSCQILFDGMKQFFGWVGSVDKDRSRIIPIYSGGINKELAAGLVLDLNGGDECQALAAEAIRLGEPKVFESDRKKKNGQWSDFIEQTGCKESCMLPIRVMDEVVALLFVCSTERNMFQGEMLVLLKELADDIALGIEFLREKRLRIEAQQSLKAHLEQLGEIVKQRTAELEAAHEKLLQQEKLAVMGQLAGGVGHELRNPLGVINNAVYYLKMVLETEDDLVRENLDMISYEVRRARKIINDLLGFSTRRGVDRSQVSVALLVDQVLSEHPPTEGIELELDILPDLPPIFVDEIQIRQALLNLVTNAYQAMPDGGVIRIAARKSGLMVEIAVSDTGCGIPKENISKLFDPLFTTKPGGIGLGLSVSKNFAEFNGGSISVASEPNKGSTFTLLLPTKDAVDGG